MLKSFALWYRSQTDSGLVIFAACLAGASTVFASYMFIKGPGSPEITQALTLPVNHSIADMASASEQEADMMTTASLTNGLPQTTSHPTQVNPQTNFIGYRLQMVVNQTAYVDVSAKNETRIYPVKTGQILPGLGKVKKITTTTAGWVLYTDKLKLQQNHFTLIEAPS